ncbi:Methylmalonate-semialdehyde dehydrogenase [acylating] mitochondrial, partial [Coemansia furcata]
MYRLGRTLTPVARFRGALSTRLSHTATTKLFIDGQFVESQTNEWLDVHNPATQEVVTRVPKTTASELEEAAQSAHSAFKEWSRT